MNRCSDCKYYRFIGLPVCASPDNGDYTGERVGCYKVRGKKAHCEHFIEKPAKPRSALEHFLAWIGVKVEA
jgi:hypothetical protein